MRKNEVFPYYRKTVEDFNKVYAYIKSQFTDGYVDELCKVRGYVSTEQRDLIANMELGTCSIFAEDLGEIGKELGLISKFGEFILNDRFIVPINDISNNLVALVGYYCDSKKYITTKSPFFSKEQMFFNFRQAYDLSWSKFDGLVFIVEGIFDTLSMASIGLPCIGCMGSSLSKDKGELLKLFKHCVGIPDDDKTGKRSLNRYDKYGWQVPSNTTLVNLHGGSIKIDDMVLHVKDMDNFVSWFDKESVIEILLEVAKSTEEVEDLYL